MNWTKEEDWYYVDDKLEKNISYTYYDLRDNDDRDTGWHVCQITEKHISDLFARDEWAYFPKDRCKTGWYICPDYIGYLDDADNLANALFLNYRYDTLKAAKLAAQMMYAAQHKE
jgi:hypothetical protein